MGRVATGGGSTRYGVFCAIVLIALLSLLHATRTPGARHLIVPDTDRCSASALRQSVVPVVGDAPGDRFAQADAPTGDPGGRHGSAVGTPCTVGASRPRHLSTASSASAVVETIGVRIAGATEAVEVAARTGPTAPGGAPARTVVLRC
ncbi:hypothetical protein [Embleya sp. NBC_00896]|uniref:hypothetical protein n=1 Tax=Embleya sp. NBC_00896 TaxID=2975961 RepID=UPI002F906696|nr:hypothetical protein OG928_36480 [Embleya sp. NBC_00896]